MVNEKELRKVLARVFTEGDPRYSNRHSEYVSKKRKLERYERRNRGTFAFYMKKVSRVLDEIEKALNEDIEW